MKKLLCLILSFLISSSLVCCAGISHPPSGSRSERSNPEGSGPGGKSEEKLDQKEAKDVIEGYLTALVLRDQEGAKNFYSAKLKGSIVNIEPAKEPHPNGYRMGATEDSEGKIEGKVTVYSVSTGSPYFASDENTVTVVKEKGSYVIDGIEKSKSTEVIEKDKSLFMKKEGEISGKEIIKLDDLPKFGSPQGGTAGQRFTVGHDGFGPIALDGDGKKLALASYGTYPSLIVVDIEGKKATVFDLFFEGVPLALNWSGDGRFLSLLMSGADGRGFMNIYEVEQNKKIDDPIRDTFDRGKFSISTPYWDGENKLLFNVSGAAGTSGERGKQDGAYRLDPEKLSLTKL